MIWHIILIVMSQIKVNSQVNKLTTIYQIFEIMQIILLISVTGLNSEVLSKFWSIIRLPVIIFPWSVSKTILSSTIEVYRV